MAVDVEELFLQPFQEVVDRAREALGNAEQAGSEHGHSVGVMLAAAQGLVREGERAIKKLRPLWDSQVDKYGDAFKSSLLKQDELDDKRRILQDMLYDFEDFLTIDEFDAKRFADMQAASKSLALHSIEVIRRLKVDALPNIAKPSFPPLPPLPPTVSRPSSRASNISGFSRRSPLSHTPSMIGVSRTQIMAEHMGERSFSPGVVSPPVGRANSGDQFPSPSLTGTDSVPAPSTSIQSMRTINRPREAIPSAVPAAVVRASTAQSQFSDTDTLPPYSLELHAVPALPPISPRRYSGSQRPGQQQESRSGGAAPTVTHRRDTSSAGVEAPRRSSETESSVGDIPDFPIPRTRTTAWVSDQLYSTEPSGSDQTPGSVVVTGTVREQHPLDSVQHMTLAAQRARSASPGLTENLSQYMINFDSPHSPVLSTLSHLTVGQSSVSSLQYPSTPQTQRTSPSSQNTSLPPSRDGRSTPPLVVKQNTISEVDEAELRPDSRAFVQPSEVNFPSSASSVMAQRLTDGCNITTRSSLYAMNGFCAGAQAYKMSGADAGIKNHAGHVAGMSTAIARCASCSYGHSGQELELDNGRDPRATFARDHGVMFRIRFLYKSHLPATRTSEAYYGCLFCAKSGSTIYEQDATVFKNSDELLEHMAHHTQPLPEVQGLTVLYGKQILKNDPRVNDFDLWLTEATVGGSGIPDEATKYVMQLPRATATKSHVQRYGEKKLARPDGTSVKLCEFFVGSRIIGIDFPSRHAGKWCTGWHNGSWGYFPSKSIELEMPRRHEIPPILAGIDTSGFTVTAKWKWELGKDTTDKDKAWLTFDKGDKITNVAWVGQDLSNALPLTSKSEVTSLVSSNNITMDDGWCWSGTTSKGKFGLFPKSHIDRRSLKEDAPQIRPSTASKSKNPQGKKGLFGGRRRPSVSGISTASGKSVVEII